MTRPESLSLAVVDALDETSLDRLAERLAPRIAERLAKVEGHWFSAREAADYLGLSVHALHKLTAARAIPFEQEGPGCRLWFRRSELDRWRRGGGLGTRRSASTPLPHSREAAS